MSDARQYARPAGPDSRAAGENERGGTRPRRAIGIDEFAICEDDADLFHARAGGTAQEVAWFMHVISKKKLREFWEEHPRAQAPLEAWYQVAKSAEWESFADVRKTFNTADQVGKFTVFDIGGNKYRLIAVIHSNRGKLYVRHVLTHAEYDEGKWKDE
jgi:mRNA interferase HigB